LALQLYAQDHDELMPEAGAAWGALQVDSGVFRCPSAGKRVANAYVLNDKWMGKTLGEFTAPAENILGADGQHTTTAATATAPATYTGIGYRTADYLARHGKRLIAAYADGHVAAIARVPTAELSTPFDPTHVPGLYLWLAADQITGVASGASLTNWPDRSGNNRHATTYTGLGTPKYLAAVAGLKNLPAVTFDGGQGLAYTPASQPAGDYYAIIVTVSTRTQSSGWARSFAVTTNATNWEPWNDGIQLCTLVGPGNEGPFAARVQATADTTTASLKSIFVGGWTGPGGTQYFIGEIGEVAFYSQHPSTADRTRLTDYLKAKYAIP
jgi:prepilin-type processing-associated H-X9-DG protein